MKLAQLELSQIAWVMGHVWCVHLTVRLLRLDWLSVHVSQATTELLMRGPVWPAHVSQISAVNIANNLAIHLC